MTEKSISFYFWKKKRREKLERKEKDYFSMFRIKFRNKKIDQNIRKKHKIADDEKLKKSKQIMGICFSKKSLNR